VDKGQACAPTGGRDGALRALEALPQTPPGGKPPGTPMISLDTGRPSHGSRDREGAVDAFGAARGCRNVAPHVLFSTQTGGEFDE